MRYLSLSFRTSRKIPRSKNNPTPADTMAMNSQTLFKLEFSTTCFASTIRSGSAKVIRKPITNALNSINHILFLRDSVLPTPLPRVIIDPSAPKENSAMPRISKTALMLSIILS